MASPLPSAALGIVVCPSDVPVSPNSSRQESLPCTTNQQKDAWKAALTGSLSPSQDRPPTAVVVDGTAHVAVPADILTDQKPLWNDFIVGHFLGDVSPHIGKVHATVNRLWQNQDGKLKIDAQFLSPKKVLFRIENDQVRSRVLRRLCWHISDIPMVVQQWSPSSANDQPNLSSIPIWVDFHHVPDNLFSKKGILFLGNTIGVALRLHPNTERCLRFDVARVLVEVNLNAELPSSICLLSDPENKIPVYYPWLPTRCSSCCAWGHSIKDCTRGPLKNDTITTILKEKVSADLHQCLDPVATPAQVNEEVASVNILSPSKEVNPVSTHESPVLEKTEVSKANRGPAIESPIPSTSEVDSHSVLLPRDDLWTLVTKNKKSPANTRMMKGVPVDLAQIPSTQRHETDSEDGETHIPQQNSLPSDEKDEPNLTVTLGDHARDLRSTRKPTNKKETRQLNSKKSSSRKA